MAQSARWYMDVAGQILAGMGARTNDALQEFVEENGLTEGIDLNLVQLAYGFSPEPIGPDFLIKRTPYANPDPLVTQMDEAVERGWLEALGEDRYKISARGAEVTAGLFELADGVFAAVQPLPDDELKRIVALLFAVVETALQLPEPEGKWALSWGEKFDRGPDAPLMVQARRRLLDLLSYRDDVHVAAWQPYGIGGQEWEAFTLICRGEAATAGELVEKLPYRRYDEAGYQEALETLVARGWIKQENGEYVATAQGTALRQEAEDATDRFFDAAWVSLGEAEMEELQELLCRLAKTLEPADDEPGR